MPITNHVTSLELSRRLKELKVPQNSHFVWFNNSGITGDAFWTLGYKEEIIDNGVTLYPEKTISAYLASELGEMLPYRIGKERFNHFTLRMWNEYSGLSLLSYEKPTFDEVKGQGTIYLHSTNADTEANARAKMLIYLLENHLISVEELGK